MRIDAVVFLSVRQARRGALLTRLRKAAGLRRFAANQRYAAHQPGWHLFRRQLAHLPAYELRRAAHPHQAVEALQALLAAPRR
jgi:hypothetical protein